MRITALFVLLLVPFAARAQAISSPTYDLSGTITAGGTFQQIAGPSLGRRSVEFDNICSVASACTATTDKCYLFFGPTASASKTANAIPIAAGASYVRENVVPNDAIQATCDSTGDHFRLAVQ